MSGTKEEIELIQGNIVKVKKFLGEGNPNNVTNKTFIDTLVRFYLDKNVLEEEEKEKQSADVHFADTSYSSVRDVKSAEEQLFVTSQSAVDRLFDHVHQLKVLEMILTRKSTILSRGRQNPIESFKGGKR